MKSIFIAILFMKIGFSNHENLDLHELNIPELNIPEKENIFIEEEISEENNIPYYL